MASKLYGYEKFVFHQPAKVTEGFETEKTDPLKAAGNNISKSKNLMKWKTLRIINVMTLLESTLNLKCYV